MRKLITFVLKDQIDSTRVVLEGLRKCEGIEGYSLLVHTNPSTDESLALLRHLAFPDVELQVQREKLPLGHAINLVWKNGFSKADFIIHLAHDTVPTRDCLRFMEYCDRKYRRDAGVFSIAAHGGCPSASIDPYAISRRSEFNGWTIGLWRERWEFIRNQWRPELEKCTQLVNEVFVRRALKEVYPLRSRSRILPTAIQAAKRTLETSQRDREDDLNPGPYHDLFPLVTAVMITGMHPARYSLARVAIDCFKAQSYPNKELLIVNHGPESLFEGEEGIQELRLKKAQSATVGDLRNIALDHANGEFIIGWDDDDWFHPERISVQMDAQKGDAAVFLKNRIAYSFRNHNALYLKAPCGAEATILHPKDVPFRYPSLVRQSDTVFARRFRNRTLLENDPALYFRFYHGLNLWDAEHIMRHLANPKVRNQIELDEKHKSLLKQILAQYHSPQNALLKSSSTCSRG